METIEDIVREMREQGKHNKENIDLDWLTEEVGDLQLRIADRIETAVKHQFRDTTKTIPHEKVGVRDAANNELLNSIKSYQINSSKARKALEEIMAYVADMVCRSERNESLRKAIYNSARYALSAPPRNCDVIEAMNADHEFEKAMGYPPSQTADERDELMRENWFLFKAWLFAEAKGEAE
jgi:hypothetical protein